MKTLCVGGSFNPIHYAHLRCAQAVANRKAFGRVVLIPSAQPPHKPGATDLAPAADRLAMCKLAATAMDSVMFETDDLELRRTGPSFTYDTALELKRRGWATVSWMIGADMLMYLPKWHRAQELIREVEFVIVARPGWTMDWSQLPQAFQPLQANVVEAPRIDISATDIRRRVKAGESIEGLTPPGVIAYIEAKGLYQ
jgi:nicotinate-nucleotide adenylyltransferase